MAVGIDGQIIVAIASAPLVGSAQSALDLVRLLLLKTGCRVAQMVVHQRAVLRIRWTNRAGRCQLAH